MRSINRNPTLLYTSLDPRAAAQQQRQKCNSAQHVRNRLQGLASTQFILHHCPFVFPLYFHSVDRHRDLLSACHIISLRSFILRRHLDFVVADCDATPAPLDQSSSQRNHGGHATTTSMSPSVHNSFNSSPALLLVTRAIVIVINK